MTDTSYLYQYFLKKSETEQKPKAAQPKIKKPAKPADKKGSVRYGS